MRNAWFVALVGAIVAPVSVWGKQPSDPVMEAVGEAEKLAEQKQYDKAVPLLAGAIATAQASGAIVAEQKAVDLLDRVVSGLPDDAAPEGGSVTAVPFGTRAALASAMARLDPKRRSAFISAPGLAHSLLLLATRSGDGRFVPEAAAVLEAHAKVPKAGRSAATLAQYATGLRRAVAGAHAEAASALEPALAAAVREGWLELALHVGTELVAAYRGAGDADKAKEALERTSAAVPKDADPSVVREWSRFAPARWAGTDEAFLSPFRRAVDPFAGVASVGTAGGRGAHGAKAGGGDVSKVGEVLSKHPKAKPLVTVVRKKEGFEIREAFDSKFEAVQPYKDMTRHLEDGGVTLSFHGYAVALHMIDPEGLRGQPGERSDRSLVRAFYLLGDGETYGVLKEGLVVVS
jgi:hypothetical protein